LQDALRLSSLINEDTIRLRYPAEDWIDAVRAAGELLVVRGKILDGYVEAMIETVKELGAYIVIAPGVAMPHARPEDGVLDDAIGLVTLRQPIRFGNPENDPVSLVLALAVTDKERHIDALATLTEMLGRPGTVDSLVRSDSKAQVIQAVRAAERGVDQAG